MPIDVLVSLLISALVPYVLERAKAWRWLPVIQPYAPVLNRVTAVAVSIVTALGVTVSFDAELGVLTVAGLLPGEMLRLGMQAAGNWLVQELVYRTRIDAGRPRA